MGRVASVVEPSPRIARGSVLPTGETPLVAAAIDAQPASRMPNEMMLASCHGHRAFLGPRNSGNMLFRQHSSQATSQLGKLSQPSLFGQKVVNTVLPGASKSELSPVIGFTIAIPIGFIVLSNSFFFRPMGRCLLKHKRLI